MTAPKGEARSAVILCLVWAAVLGWGVGTWMVSMDTKRIRRETKATWRQVDSLNAETARKWAEVDRQWARVDSINAGTLRMLRGAK